MHRKGKENKARFKSGPEQFIKKTVQCICLRQSVIRLRNPDDPFARSLGLRICSGSGKNSCAGSKLESWVWVPLSPQISLSCSSNLSLLDDYVILFHFKWIYSNEIQVLSKCFFDGAQNPHALPHCVLNNRNEIHPQIFFLTPILRYDFSIQLKMCTF